MKGTLQLEVRARFALASTLLVAAARVSWEPNEAILDLIDWYAIPHVWPRGG